MKALVLKEYNRFSFEDVPTPAPGPNEVLVEVKACGICGSDVHGMDGSTGRRRPPIIMGHEASGVIADVGSGVAGWRSGQPVTFDSTIYCGECDFCRRGMVNLCDRRRVLGVSCEDYRQHGAFAQFVTVPQRILYPLPAGLPFEHAALVEPFSIALHAVNRAMERGSLSRSSSEVVATAESSPSNQSEAAAAQRAVLQCVVIGAGMIGQALVQALAQKGCRNIIGVDISPERLSLASSSGATKIINSATRNAVEAILQLTEGRGADVCLEAVGVAPTVDLALRCLRKGGTAVLVGNVAPKVEFPLQTAVTRELSVLGSCASRGEYPQTLELLAAGALRAAPLISATAPLSQGAEWFQRLYRKEPGLLKVVLRP